MATITEPAGMHPPFPPCLVRGHTHPLGYLYTVVQDGTGQRARMLECPSGRYRFFFIEEAYARTGRMIRYTQPRWGWKTVSIDG